ncbi:DICT sensory domain-containing protein [Natrinema sp. 1APR25-10V2]|uniref:DICT sensory domain-containing protein n=1 Tax=Natrinema sp. 1APR25-10V2 TaxID=2951081 RepID=UPI002875B159|nr:DICT sensory domain-containing protein [Natrinema sp. 1APR25-10V2]MDS0474481.1 histidine kinase [Natrinema sp. 1APR25-10V2]
MNSLAAAIRTIERRRKTLEVRTDDDAVVEELRRQFETRNVDVTHRSLGSLDETGFVIVRDADGAFRGALGIDQFQMILSPEIHPPWELAETDDDRAELFDFLENTLFTSYDRRQMLATSREIEERAWRVGSGKLYAGFQRPAALAAQTDIYERLGSRGSLTVAVFLDGAWNASAPDNVTVVSTSDGELGEYWFVAFDGGGNEIEACALLAEERRDGEYYGFWTYDPATVADLVSHLEATYGVA